MPKIMEIIEKETRGKSYHTYKYSYDSIGVPSIAKTSLIALNTERIQARARCIISVSKR